MRIDILTIFPAFFDSPLREGVVFRACERGVLDIRVHDLRAWTTDKHRVTDDAPYGGGAGMVMKPEPLFAAIEQLKAENPGRPRCCSRRRGGSGASRWCASSARGRG